jgi:hypothetical protein
VLGVLLIIGIVALIIHLKSCAWCVTNHRHCGPYYTS